MADTISVGVLRATLAADTAKWTMGLREATTSLSSFENSSKKATDSIAKGMAAAGKAASDSSKLIAGMGAAGQQAAAQVQAAMQSQAQKAAEWQQMLQRSAAASEAAVKSFNETSQAGSKAGQILLGVAAVLGTINFGAAAVEAATAASRIQDASERMQIGTDAVQRLAFAAEQSGGSLEAVAMAVGRMADTLGSADADKKLAAIGLSFEQIKGLTPDQTFIAIAEAIRKIPDPLKQSDEATNIFGKSALQLLPAIRAGFKDVGDQAPIMSKSVIEAGDRVGDKLHEIELRMTNLKAEALLPFADFFTTHLPTSVQIGIAGLSSFIPSLEQLTLGVLAFGGPSGAWKAMVLAFSSISTAAKTAALSFWPLAAAIAAVWAAWQIGNTETVKNSIATWALSSDNLTAKLFRAVSGIDQMTEAQARQAVSATAAAEQAHESAKAVSAVEAAMTKALAPTASLTGQLSQARLELAGLSQEQRENIAAGLALGESIKEVAKAVGVSEAVVTLYKSSVTEATKAQEAGAKAAKESAKDYEAFSKSVQKTHDALADASFHSAQAILKDERKAAEATADAWLKAFKIRTDAEEELSKITREQGFERMQAEIDFAKSHGATWQEVYDMETRLSAAKLQAAIDDSEREFQIRTAGMDRTTAEGERAYQALKAVHDATIAGMLETHQRAEATKREELLRTHDVWVRSMEAIKALWANLTTVISENLTKALLSATSFKDAFVSIWHSIRDSLLSIFSDILNSFIKTVLDGALGAIMGRKGAFSQAFGSLFDFGGSGGILNNLLGKGGAAAAGVLGSAGAAGATTMIGGIPVVAGTGAAGGVGAAATGGAAGGGGLGALGAFFTNPWTIGIGAAIAGGLAIWKSGLFRGGEEGTKVNPARDAFFQGYQQQYGGDPFSALAAAFADKGVSGDIAERLIKALYDADSMKEFEAATQAIRDALAGASQAAQQTADGVSLTAMALNQFNATIDHLETMGTVSEEAINALRAAIAGLSATTDPEIIAQLNATLTQMMASGTMTDETLATLVATVQQMSAQSAETTTATDDLTGASSDLEQQIDRNNWMTTEMRQRLVELEAQTGSVTEAWARLVDEMSQPIDVHVNVPNIDLGNYISGGGSDSGGMYPSFATEGIARSPMLAMVGDAGPANPEWILHQSSVMGMARDAYALGAFAGQQASGLDSTSGRSGTSGGGITIGSINVSVDGAGATAPDLARQLVTEIPRALRYDHGLVTKMRKSLAGVA